MGWGQNTGYLLDDALVLLFIASGRGERGGIVKPKTVVKRGNGAKKFTFNIVLR